MTFRQSTAPLAPPHSTVLFCYALERTAASPARREQQLCRLVKRRHFTKCAVKFNSRSVSQFHQLINFAKMLRVSPAHSQGLDFAFIFPLDILASTLRHFIDDILRFFEI